MENNYHRTLKNISVPGQGGQEMEADTAGSSTLPHQGDIVRIATKLGNVVLDPLDCHQLVKHTGVTGNILGSEVEEGQGGHSVLNPNHDNVLFGCHGSEVIQIKRGGS